MGDRTYCSTYINKHYYEQHKAELDEIKKEGYYEFDKEGDLIKFSDDQANYGDMPLLVEFLSEREIEYDKSWESGGDYDAGTEHARKVNGEYKVVDIYAGGEDLINNFKEILACEPSEREALILKKLEQLEPFEITELSAPQSIDFIKNA